MVPPTGVDARSSSGVQYAASPCNGLCPRTCKASTSDPIVTVRYLAPMFLHSKARKPGNLCDFRAYKAAMINSSDPLATCAQVSTGGQIIAWYPSKTSADSQQTCIP